MWIVKILGERGLSKGFRIGKKRTDRLQKKKTLKKYVIIKIGLVVIFMRLTYGLMSMLSNLLTHNFK